MKEPQFILINFISATLIFLMLIINFDYTLKEIIFSTLIYFCVWFIFIILFFINLKNK